MSEFEQCTNIKFIFKLMKNVKDTLQALWLVYGETALKKSSVYDMIRIDLKMVKNHWKTTLTVDTLPCPEMTKMLQIWRNSFKVVQKAEELRLSDSPTPTSFRHLLYLCKVCSSNALRLWNEPQEDCCRDLFMNTKLRLLDKVMTGEESYVSLRQEAIIWMAHNLASYSHPHPKKSWATYFNIRVMLIAFFDDERMVHCRFVPMRANVNMTLHAEVLTLFRGRFKRKRPRKWKEGWTLHHYNVLRLMAITVQQYYDCTTLLYSSDLSPCDIWLFPKAHTRCGNVGLPQWKKSKKMLTRDCVWSNREILML